MAEESGNTDSEGFNNRIALTIALLVTFLAISTIKSGNVEQAVAQAQAERNNSWAWYQAVRVREDMATYELANLQRLLRVQSPAAPQGEIVPPTAEARALAQEIAAQEQEVVHVRARKDEVEHRAQAAELDLAHLNTIADQYDFSDALLAIAMALFAVCALAKVRWLYWFSLLPTLAGLAWGVAAMLQFVIPAQAVMAWLN